MGKNPNRPSSMHVKGGDENERQYKRRGGDCYHFIINLISLVSFYFYLEKNYQY